MYINWDILFICVYSFDQILEVLTSLIYGEDKILQV